MRGRNIQRAIDAVKEKGIDTDLKLYDKIEEMPGENIYKSGQDSTTSLQVEPQPSA